MLLSQFPRSFHRFLSLPLLGPIADRLDGWLATTGYTRGSRKGLILRLPQVDADLRRRGVKQLADLTLPVLRDSCCTLRKPHPFRARTVRILERYLVANNHIANIQPATANSPSLILIEEYAHHLSEVRGLAAGTVSNQRYTAQCFLQHLANKRVALKDLRIAQIESYITEASKRLSRRSLQGDISRLRGFLRFLAVDGGSVPANLAGQIDTPRLYRFEQLPRALPWETVRALLRSIDRTSATGVRDYAIFLLMATYGLRASEVVAITPDDFHWRQGRLRVHQRKTSSELELPLTNEVMCVLAKHLKRTPPSKSCRRIFVKMRAPIGALTSKAVTAAFDSWARKSGLPIPFHGPHCLRHSLAVHLLKKRTPLKTIGDILGHRSPESTSTYLRLATEDLREVPLPVPGTKCHAKGERP
jgi:integrase/recombinase XerD